MAAPFAPEEKTDPVFAQQSTQPADTGGMARGVAAAERSIVAVRAQWRKVRELPRRIRARRVERVLRLARDRYAWWREVLKLRPDSDSEHAPSAAVLARVRHLSVRTTAIESWWAHSVVDGALTLVTIAAMIGAFSVVADREGIDFGIPTLVGGFLMVFVTLVLLIIIMLATNMLLSWIPRRYSIVGDFALFGIVAGLCWWLLPGGGYNAVARGIADQLAALGEPDISMGFIRTVVASFAVQSAIFMVYLVVGPPIVAIKDYLALRMIANLAPGLVAADHVRAILARVLRSRSGWSRPAVRRRLMRRFRATANHIPSAVKLHLRAMGADPVDRKWFLARAQSLTEELSTCSRAVVQASSGRDYLFVAYTLADNIRVLVDGRWPTAAETEAMTPKRRIWLGLRRMAAPVFLVLLGIAVPHLPGLTLTSSGAASVQVGLFVAAAALLVSPDGQLTSLAYGAIREHSRATEPERRG